MKLHFTDEWLKNWIAEEPEVDFEIGPEIEGASEFNEVARAREEAIAASAGKAASRGRTMLAVFLARLRRRDGLSIKQLSERLGVKEADVRQTETDPLFSPSQRFIERVANFVNYPVFEVQRLASSREQKWARGLDSLSSEAGVGEASARKRRRKSSEEFVQRFHKKNET